MDDSLTLNELLLNSGISANRSTLNRFNEEIKSITGLSTKSYGLTVKLKYQLLNTYVEEDNLLHDGVIDLTEPYISIMKES
jgi:hypothetical protein